MAQERQGFTDALECSVDHGRIFFLESVMKSQSMDTQVGLVEDPSHEDI